MAADAHHVLWLPKIGHGACHAELDWNRLPACANVLHVGVDARHEGLGVALRIRTVGGPLFVHLTAIEKQAGGSVLSGVGRAEVFGEEAEPAFTPEINLPKPIARGVEALQEDGVTCGAGIDVRDTPLIDNDLGRLLEALYVLRAAADALERSAEAGETPAITRRADTAAAERRASVRLGRFVIVVSLP
jgi:hypothetical protein